MFRRPLHSATRIVTGVRTYTDGLPHCGPNTGHSGESIVKQGAGSVFADPTRPIAAEWFGSLSDQLGQAAHVFSTRVAVSDRYGDSTYQDIDAAAAAVAAELARRGVGRGDRVVIVADRAGALVWALLGVMRLGAIFCIFDPSHPSSRLRAALQTVSPKLILVAAPPDLALVDDWNDGDQPVDVLKLPTRPTDFSRACDGTLAHENGRGATQDGHPDDTAYIALTSGSTGVPRAVEGPHRPLSHFFWWYTSTFDFSADDRFSAVSGLGHDPLLRDIFTPLLIGARVCFPGELSVTSADLARWVFDTGITVMHATPSHVDLLSTMASGFRGTRTPRLPSLRYFFSGGEALTSAGLKDLYALAPNAHVVNFYGATETPQAIAWFDVGTQRDSALSRYAGRGKVPVGRGIHGVQLLVLDAALAPTSTDVEGEICVRTPYLARGYLNEAQLSAGRFLADPFVSDSEARLYRTGDAGIRRSDGTVEFSRRMGTTAKVRGFRVEPADVEQALRQCSDVRQCAILVEEDVHGESMLKAYVVGERAGAPPSMDRLRAELSSLLPAYMLPGAYVWLPVMPLTPSGKVDRLALGRTHVQPRASDQQILPRSPTERHLAMIWQELLGVDSVGLQDDFFGLGGHSLLALELFVRIEQRWGLRLPLTTLLRGSTLASLIQIIDNPVQDAEWFSLVPIQPLGRRAPLYCIHGLFGDVLTFVDLARALGDDQPTFGLQARGLDGIQDPTDRVEAMAASYVQEILGNQPTGPYRLLGFSSGGLVAYEMGRQLTQMGHEVAFLGIIDEPAPSEGPSQPPLRPELLLENAIANIPYWVESFAASSPQERGKLVRDRLRTLGMLKKQDGQRSATGQTVRTAELQFEDFIQPFLEMEDMAYVRSWPAYRRRVVMAQLRASRRYAPRRYDGDVTVFRARRQPLLQRFERELGWSRVVNGAVDVVVVPGSHRRMLAPPYVWELAARIRECLQRNTTQLADDVAHWSPITHPRTAAG
jgi:amino acid adenylation domain-containing protein